MKTDPNAPKRPILKYYGGKWNIAPWIISHFPKHKNYVEPCGGAASVLLQKPRSLLETYNDLDGNVVNFFRVLRDRPDEFMRKISLTPWSREEFETCRTPSKDEMENARRFFVQSWLVTGRSAFDPTSGMRMDLYYNANPKSLYFDEVNKIAERLIGVQIEHKDSSEIISKYDNEDSLIYFDPPYPHITRTHDHAYGTEFSDEQHIESAQLLRQCVGHVVVSGYSCQLYTDIYEKFGWKRVDKESQTNSGGTRTESLWLSPRTVDALNLPSQVAMF